MVKITRLGVGSWVKFVAVAHVLVAGLAVLVLVGMALLGRALLPGAQGDPAVTLLAAALPGLTLIGVYAALGALAGLVQAVIVNVVLGLCGGVEVELQGSH